VPSHVAVHQGRDVKREVHGNHRNSLSLGINDQLRPIVSALYETIFPQIPRITAALDLKSFVVGYHDAACIAFGDGAFFAKHVDRYRRFSADRVLSWVYYISKTPTPFTGGDLVFYRGQSEIERITPEPRKLIVFRSDVQHEVERVMCPSKSFADCRFAITGFLHARPTLLREGLDAARYKLYPYRSATPIRAAAKLVRRFLRP
jgi:Rps23 Pro-64 3,4-dihydroxylase Tpa1-like proline 4-hydroxylase